MINKLSTIMGNRLINISEVSANTGVSRNTISSIYNRKNIDIKLNTIIKLCDYFNVPLHEIIDYYPKNRMEG